LALAIPLLPLLARIPRPPRAAPGGACAAAILVRHAEKDPAGDPKDPGLSEAGGARARALAQLFARAGVSHLFASEYRRTRDTLAPLAAARSLEVEVVPASDAAGLAARIRALPAGSLALVAGHSNTVPAIARALGAELADLAESPSGPALRDDEYARAFVLAFPAAAEPASEKASRPGAKPGDPPAALCVELAYGA